MGAKYSEMKSLEVLLTVSCHGEPRASLKGRYDSVEAVLHDMDNGVMVK